VLRVSTQGAVMFVRNLTVATAAALLTAAIAGTALAQETYVIDPVHSQPMFEVQHMGFSLQRGVFSKATGKITLDRSARKGAIDVTIDATSVKTIDPKLDTHIRSEDFFNVAQYPSMTFKSSELSFDGDRVVGADGELTMLGITKPVKLKVANLVCGDHPFTKKALCGAEVTTTIKRSDWGMKYGIPKALGDDVKIMIPVEAYKE
jgi:polyisoprenoid-binding protein YceI